MLTPWQKPKVLATNVLNLNELIARELLLFEKPIAQLISIQ
jgi:hypothetical protein